ncbi:olfactory receptor 2B11-like [Hippopotamus amphibius kiboko]|uniref:olfactory receptor 2B11-like n=1 Tax=Hippopotamus amphibius kiboko TaxID=575201 RepID=UPI002591A5CA|nr:olfactory receptor 2B11-like [Hippopotamus amphibius kiboko]
MRVLIPTWVLRVPTLRTQSGLVLGSPLPSLGLAARITSVFSVSAGPGGPQTHPNSHGPSPTHAVPSGGAHLRTGPQPSSPAGCLSPEGMRRAGVSHQNSRKHINESFPGDFILMGFTKYPWLDFPLFFALLISYRFTLLGNIAIILVSQLDSQLQSPMYFFLTSLSFLDLCFTTTTVPQMLFSLGGPNKNITYIGCMTQAYVFHWLGCAECVLLGSMTLDRYVAVCKPLRYSLIMNHKLCRQLSNAAWLIGLANSLLQSTLTVQLPLCGNQELDNFFCELPGLIKMACVDTTVNELTLAVVATFLIMGPLSMILVSYSYIAQAVFRIPSADGRLKAFNTCSSHLLVVSLFYGPGIYIYMQPSGDSPQDLIKVLTLFYCVITSVANPFIHTLRNKDVKGALRTLLRRAILSKRM